MSPVKLRAGAMAPDKSLARQPEGPSPEDEIFLEVEAIRKRAQALRWQNILPADSFVHRAMRASNAACDISAPNEVRNPAYN